MSYQIRRRVARPRRGLGDDFTDWLNGNLKPGGPGVPGVPVSAGSPSESSLCLDAANATTAPLDARVADLAANWNPTGYYSPDQVTQITTSTLTLLRSAASVVEQAMHDPDAPDARAALMQFYSEINGRSSDSLQFTQAVGAAHAQNINVIDSTGLRRWVIDSMTSASSAIAAAAYVNCQRPWWVGALAAFQSAFDALYNLVSKIIGILVKIGETVLEIPDTVATLVKYAKWIGLAGLAYYAAVKLKLIPDDPFGLR